MPSSKRRARRAVGVRRHGYGSKSATIGPQVLAHVSTLGLLRLTHNMSGQARDCLGHSRSCKRRRVATFSAARSWKAPTPCFPWQPRIGKPLVDSLIDIGGVLFSVGVHRFWRGTVNSTGLFVGGQHQSFQELRVGTKSTRSPTFCVERGVPKVS